MTCGVIGTKPLPKPLVILHQWNSKKHIQSMTYSFPDDPEQVKLSVRQMDFDEAFF